MSPSARLSRAPLPAASPCVVIAPPRHRTRAGRGRDIAPCPTQVKRVCGINNCASEASWTPLDSEAPLMESRQRLVRQGHAMNRRLAPLVLLAVLVLGHTRAGAAMRVFVTSEK